MPPTRRSLIVLFNAPFLSFHFIAFASFHFIFPLKKSRSGVWGIWTPINRVLLTSKYGSVWSRPHCRVMLWPLILSPLQRSESRTIQSKALLCHANFVRAVTFVRSCPSSRKDIFRVLWVWYDAFLRLVLMFFVKRVFTLSDRILRLQGVIMI